jgi:hypothetical protein
MRLAGTAIGLNDDVAESAVQLAITVMAALRSLLCGKYTSRPVPETENTPKTGNDPVESRTPLATGLGDPVTVKYSVSNGCAINVLFCMKSKCPCA